MATTDQINASISLGEAYYVQLLDQDNTNSLVGMPRVNSSKLKCLNRLMSALGWDLDIGNNDQVTTNIYQLLLNIIFGYNGVGVTVDPDVVIPGKVINVTINGSKVNSDKIEFINQTVITLSDYPSLFYPLYGNSPYLAIFVSDGVGGFAEDKGTALDYVYSVANDPTSNILSVSWGYGIATSGYIQISGVQPS